MWIREGGIGTLPKLPNNPDFDKPKFNIGKDAKKEHQEMKKTINVI